MRSDALNWHDYGSYMKMTEPSSNVYSTDEKRIIMHANLSQNCSVNKDESKQSIIIFLYFRTILQMWTNYVQRRKTNQNSLLYNKKDAGDEVTYDEPNFNVSNIFEYERNNFDVSYERAYMSTSGHYYFTEMIDHISNYHDYHSQIFPIKISKKLFSASWKRKEKKSNVTSITLHVILHFSLLYL